MPDIDQTECIGPATVGGSSPGSHKKTWVEKGILVLLRRGSQVHQRRVAGTPGQIFEIDAVGDGWLEPWVKEKDKRIPAAQQPDWKTICSILNWIDHQFPRVRGWLPPFS